MSGSLQAVFMNQRSFGEPAPTVIGQAYGGGYYAGSISTTENGVATHYLVVAPKSSGQFGGPGISGKSWKNSNTLAPGCVSNIDGPQNTADMVGDGNSTTYPAAHYCNDLSIGSYTDWYMPARSELEICYYNLKPSTQANVTSTGINNFSVPKRTSNYTTTVPGQTSAADFKTTGSEFFDNPSQATAYWSSTQNGATFGTAKYFHDGYQINYIAKTTASFAVRAVRRVPV
jgi:hypothetical protein